MKKVLGVFGSIGSFIVILIAMGIGKVGGRAVGEAITSPNPDAQLAEAARQYDAKLPMMVDSETRLDSTSAGPNLTLNSFYTLVNYRAQDVSSDFVGTVRPVVMPRVCTASQNMLSRGVTMVYHYRSNDGREVGSFAIRQTDCASVSTTGTGITPLTDLQSAAAPSSSPAPVVDAAAFTSSTGASASDKVNYRNPRNGKCWDQYQAALAEIPADAPLGDAAELNEKAQRRLDQCVSRR